MIREPVENNSIATPPIPKLYMSDYLCVRYNFKRNKINDILDEMIKWDISIKDLETELDRRASDLR